MSPSSVCRSAARSHPPRRARCSPSAERRIELDHERELKTAEAITERLGNMKGALMKLGQMASYVDEGAARRRCAKPWRSCSRTLRR